APSTKFTPALVAAQLSMSSPNSARDNIVIPLRRLGLIDDDGGLTSRGNKWRIDSTYDEACQEILDDVYPPDLMALSRDDGEPDRDKVRTWFDHQGFGASNANQMAATFVMIAKKQAPEPPDVTDSNKPKKSGASTKRRSTPNGGSTDLGKPSIGSEAGTNQGPP